MTGKPQTGGLAALLREEKKRKASANQRSESDEQIKREKMKLTEARRYLGISFTTMTKLIKKGVLAYESDPLDTRVKLVRKSDLDNLLKQSKNG